MTLSFPPAVRRTGVLAISVATLALALVTAGPAAAKTYPNKPITLTVGYIGTAGIFTGPDGFAYKRGVLQKWLKTYKITLKGVAGFANGPLLSAALIGGSLNLGEVGDTPGLIARSQGAPTRVINQEQVGLQSVLISQKSITSIQQLVGKDIYRQPQSYLDRWVQGVLYSKGLLSKVTLIGALSSSYTPAFNSGQIPAIVTTPSSLPEITAKYNILVSSKTTPNLDGTGVTEITDAALKQDPNLPAAWNAAHSEAVAYANKHASAYYAFEATAEATTVALAKKYDPLSLSPAQPFTTYGLKLLQGTLNFLISSKNITKPFTLKSWEASS